MKEDIFSKKDNFTEWKHVKSTLLVGDYSNCHAPQVSIIMPVYNKEKYMRQAIQSCINQDCDFEYEIIVVDNNADGSKSINQTIVEEFQCPYVYYYRNDKNIGMIGNWNRGIELARAKYVTFCHDDDILLPSALNVLMSLQRKYRNKCILSAYNYIDDDGCFISEKKFPRRKKHMKFLKEKSSHVYSLFDLFYDNVWCGGGCLFSKQNLMELGGFNDYYLPAADYAMNIKYTYYYGAVCNAIPTYNYRLCSIQASSSAWVNAVKKMDECRRDMISKMPYPSSFLNRLRVALFNMFTVQYNSQHNVLKEEDVRAFTSRDKRLIKWSFLYSRSIKPYKISFKK